LARNPVSESPCADLEPQPGDFDRELATIDQRYVAAHAGDPDAKVRIVVSIEGEDADGSSASQLIAARRRAW
jgi:hypothetical protein